MVHIPKHDLELYHLGILRDDALAPLEEHLLACPACAERAEECAAFVDGFKLSVHPNESRLGRGRQLDLQMVANRIREILTDAEISLRRLDRAVP